MDSLKYLESLKPSYMSLGLERVKDSIKILPFQIPKNNVIVAGTNGKGSTCAFLSSILQKSGLKVGFYSSPHLIDVNERIRINNICIDNKSFEKYIKDLKNLLKKNNLNLTYFEFLTVLSLWYFNENQTDLNILEVGLGGRLDATNVAPSFLSIITSISHDHTNILGKTLREIAREKAGIIKEKVPTLIAKQKPAVLDIILQECKKNFSKTIEISKEVKIKNAKISKEGLSFNCITRKNQYNIFTLHLGEYQIENISLAILGAEILSDILNFPLTPESIEIGISYAEWKGRLKKYFINGNEIYLDGAHNSDGIISLIKSMKKLKMQNLNIAFSALKDKNPGNLLKKILQISNKIFLFCLPTERGMNYNDWEKLCKKIGFKNYEILELHNVEKLIKEKNIKLFTGSLFFIGEVLKCLKRLE